MVQKRVMIGAVRDGWQPKRDPAMRFHKIIYIGVYKQKIVFSREKSLPAMQCLQCSTFY